MQGRARIGTSYWIHWLARGRYGNWIHLPLSLYKLYPVYICMSGLSRHRKANKHFDNSLSPAYVPTTFILKCMCCMRPFLSPTYLSKECIWIKNVLTSFWDGWKITILEQQNVKKKVSACHTVYKRKNLIVTGFEPLMPYLSITPWLLGRFGHLDEVGSF